MIVFVTKDTLETASVVSMLMSACGEDNCDATWQLAAILSAGSTALVSMGTKVTESSATMLTSVTWKVTTVTMLPLAPTQSGPSLVNVLPVMVAMELSVSI